MIVPIKHVAMEKSDYIPVIHLVVLTIFTVHILTYVAVGYCYHEAKADHVVVTPHGEVRNQTENLACCRNSFYNSDSHICCGGIVHFKGNNFMSCCSNSPYNHHTQICCGGTVGSLVEGNSTYCCGSKPYSYTTHICCEGNVLNTQGSSKACCGSTMYDPADQMCCSGTVRAQSIEDSALVAANCQ